MSVYLALQHHYQYPHPCFQFNVEEWAKFKCGALKLGRGWESKLYNVKLKEPNLFTYQRGGIRCKLITVCKYLNLGGKNNSNGSGRCLCQQDWKARTRPSAWKSKLDKLNLKSCNNLLEKIIKPWKNLLEKMADFHIFPKSSFWEKFNSLYMQDVGWMAVNNLFWHEVLWIFLFVIFLCGPHLEMKCRWSGPVP